MPCTRISKAVVAPETEPWMKLSLPETKKRTWPAAVMALVPMKLKA